MSRNHFLSTSRAQVLQPNKSSLSLAFKHAVATATMEKLNESKIRWMIKEIDKKELHIDRIAGQQNITPRWAREIYKKYKSREETIHFGKPGSKRKELDEKEIRIIKNTFKEVPLGAVKMEKYLKNKGIRIPHNRIHKIMLQEKLARKEPKKSRRRKWVRYERRHSNSLWHTDFSDFGDKYLMAYEDDASRFITAFEELHAETAENAVRLLNKGIKKFGKPREVMTDHGSQFYDNEREDRRQGETIFQKRLKELDINHILARVKHPQTNGKQERLHGTLKRLYRHFRDWNKVIYCYNYKMPHLSLIAPDGHLETPYEAFKRKMRKR